MSFIIHVHHKKNNSVYAYSVENFWDPVAKKSRQHRTYLGKVSPDTGEIIPKKETRHMKKAEMPEVPPIDNDQSQNAVLIELSKRIDQLQEENKVIFEVLRKIAEAASVQLP